MRAALHILWTACQACLGLAVIALAAVSPGAAQARGAIEAEARARTAATAAGGAGAGSVADAAAGARIGARVAARLSHSRPAIP